MRPGKRPHVLFICFAVILALVFVNASSVSAQLLTGFDHAVSVQAPTSRVNKTKALPPRLTARDDVNASNPIVREEEPVDLQADDLAYDETGRIVTATGNVILEQAGRILRADRLRYDLNADRVLAVGHVVLNEINGDIFYAQEVELRNKLKDGVVKELKGYLADGSQFSAVTGHREGGTRIVMDEASYTACEPCEDDPDATPVWQIKASEVKHIKEEHRVAYKNARMEFAGVPVFYAPYLSHSDGSIKRKTGLIAPSAGFTSDLGFFATNNYYIDIAPNKDATIGLMTATQESPMALGEYRQRWKNAELTVNGGITYSGRTDLEGGQSVVKDDEIRGFVKGEARWDMDEKWRSGVRVDWASDDQFLRQYDLDRTDILENEIYVERFSGRDYAVGRLLTFQDTRIDEDRQFDQPEVLPEITASFVGDSNAVPVIGGRWNAEGSVLGLRREGSDRDVARLSLGAGWQKRLVSDYGLLTTVDGSVRGDVYNTRDRALQAGQDNEITETRVFPQLHVQSSYPVAKQFDKFQMQISPIAAITMAPDLDFDGDIPNEDSQDVQIDSSNVFNSNRFPGLDRVEDQSRVTYGLQTGFYGYKDGFATFFLGQSRRLDDDDNPFPIGSGLNDQSSDVVGQVQAQYDGRYNLNYSFQLANRHLTSERHEVDAGASMGPLSIDTTYLYAKALEGTDISESREQIVADAIYNFTDEWGIKSGAVQDLGETPGLRRAYGAIDYRGQCLSWTLTGVRNFTDDASGDSDTEVFLRIGLKNLGEFRSAGL